MSRFDLLLRGAEVITPQGPAALDIAVTAGRIAALLPRGAPAVAAEVIEAPGLVALPGLIDIHCHIRAPAFAHRGTVDSETAAAAAGGITTVFEMPITKPCCNSAERLALRRAHFAAHARTDFGLFAAPGDLTDRTVQAAADAGAIAFKIFTTAAPPGRDDEFGGLAFDRDGDQMRALQAVARTGRVLVVHAESEGLLRHYAQAGAGLNPALAQTHGALRPAVAEAAAVAQLLAMNQVAGARLHIAHVTSAQTVDVLRRFQGSSDFSAETCPHYLVRCEADAARVGVVAKINPPLRQPADQEALWQAIAEGLITHVTTDHAAFSKAEKDQCAGDFLQAPPGTPGLEMLLPVLLESVRAGRLTLTQLAALAAGNGAARFGLPAKGRIAVGAEADLALVDLAGETRISAQNLFTQARDVAGLYDGAVFSGALCQTILRGKTIFRDGRLTGTPGDGRFVAPGSRPAERAVA